MLSNIECRIYMTSGNGQCSKLFYVSVLINEVLRPTDRLECFNVSVLEVYNFALALLIQKFFMIIWHCRSQWGNVDS